jgi:hypothetical protein
VPGVYGLSNRETWGPSKRVNASPFNDRALGQCDEIAHLYVDRAAVPMLVDHDEMSRKGPSEDLLTKLRKPYPE